MKGKKIKEMMDKFEKEVEEAIEKREKLRERTETLKQSCDHSYKTKLGRVFTRKSDKKLIINLIRECEYCGYDESHHVNTYHLGFFATFLDDDMMDKIINKLEEETGGKSFNDIWK